MIYDYDMYNALSGYSSYEDIKTALYGYVKGMIMKNMIVNLIFLLSKKDIEVHSE